MVIVYLEIQQLAEESTYRNELQMQLDSKESDIEQLRSKILDLQQGMDSTSVASLQADETDGNVSGRGIMNLDNLVLCTLKTGNSLPLSSPPKNYHVLKGTFCLFFCICFLPI